MYVHLAESKADAAGYKEVGLPGDLVRAQHAVILLPDPCFAALISYPSVPSHQKSWLHNEVDGMQSLQASKWAVDQATGVI